MDLRKIKIADLVPATYNPRKALKPGDKEYEKIKRSIEEFGYCEPVIVNSDMTIIGGHQRVTVLKDLGYSEIDCIVIDIDKTTVFDLFLQLLIHSVRVKGHVLLFSFFNFCFHCVFSSFAQKHCSAGP